MRHDKLVTVLAVTFLNGARFYSVKHYLNNFDRFIRKVVLSKLTVY